jgi:hypothetical protein
VRGAAWLPRSYQACQSQTSHMSFLRCAGRCSRSAATPNALRRSDISRQIQRRDVSGEICVLEALDPSVIAAPQRRRDLNEVRDQLKHGALAVQSCDGFELPGWHHC